MTPFLKSVAETYYKHHGADLIDFCFVFPNKRSGTFFEDYLANIMTAGSKAAVLPAITTIVDFVESFNDTAAVDRLESLFLLFDAYREIIEQHYGAQAASEADFNRFVFWGDILLQDFDDIDTSLADTHDVFHNVKTLKEISSNYLTPEQIDIIKQYWADEKVPQEVKTFWNHLSYPGENPHPDSASPSAGFLRLWQAMNDIYQLYQKKLKAKGLHSPGMAFRKANESLKEITADQLPYSRYIFVGFNSLSNSEISIFKQLKKLYAPQPIVDFYWDLESPIFQTDAFQQLSRLTRIAKEFPSLYDCISPIMDFPPVTVLGIPSRVGQAKAISDLLASEFPPLDPAAGIKEQQERKQALKRTAIVMPEENMLLPLLSSLPAEVSPINLTMGYKLRNSAVASLLRDIVSMQMRAYRNRSQLTTFFYEDVINVLSHPIVRAHCPTECTYAVLQIQQRRLFNVPEDFFQQEKLRTLAPIFTMIANSTDSAETIDYLHTLLDWLSVALQSESYPATDNHSEDKASAPTDSTTGADNKLQYIFIRRYRAALDKVSRLLDSYLPTGQSNFIKNGTIFHLIEQIMQGEMLILEGEPLNGLQIMGVLEARALDFDTLIIPSMNEKVFPRARFTASFIPVALRRAFRLPTPEDQENSYTYFFYRMISRAKQIYLLYDCRSTGLKSKQMSRYIQQLIHIFNIKSITHKVLSYPLSSPEEITLEVAKTPAIMQQIERYRSKKDARYLSASAIEQYISCPMSFYLQRIANYRREDEMHDWLDEGTFGTIVHEVFEKLYAPYADGDPTPRPITKYDLEQLASGNAHLDHLITLAINNHYHKIGDNNDTPLYGESLMIGKVIKQYIVKTLDSEQKYTPFIYISGEWEKSDVLTLTTSTGEEERFNFTCRIDRIDRYVGNEGPSRIRIIDYKTGADEVSLTDMKAAFEQSKYKVFIQLFLYSQAFAQFAPCHDIIQPMVYSLRQIMLGGLQPLKIHAPLADIAEISDIELKQPAGRSKKWTLISADDYNAEFNDYLVPYIRELFDPHKPFRFAETDAPCKYCDFKNLCRREQ